jgi:IS30 family transposase
MEYRRVTSEDRLRIKDGLDAGQSKSAIADKLGFHKSTKGREISRNTGRRCYRAKQAQRLAKTRAESKHGPYRMNPVVMTTILERLELRCSPEQISNRLRLEGQDTVSAETIYKFIDEDRKRCSKKMKIKIYFCDPYSSHQRGTNENRIGILRQYLPKKTDLTELTNRDLEKIEFEINNRPMKCLDWRTPYEVMMAKSCTGKL